VVEVEGKAVVVVDQNDHDFRGPPDSLYERAVVLDSSCPGSTRVHRKSASLKRMDAG
jgi:hypothetical protein